MTATQLKQALADSGLTLLEMGNRIGVRERTVWNWTRQGVSRWTYAKKITAVVEKELQAKRELAEQRKRQKEEAQVLAEQLKAEGKV